MVQVSVTDGLDVSVTGQIYGHTVEYTIFGKKGNAEEILGRCRVELPVGMSIEESHSHCFALGATLPFAAVGSARSVRLPPLHLSTYGLNDLQCLFQMTSDTRLVKVRSLHRLFSNQLDLILMYLSKNLY
jgi:hypothetical protein